MSTSVESLNFRELFLKSVRTTNTQLGALFALFIFPLSFSLVIYPTQILLRFYTSHHNPTLPSLVLPLLYTLLLFSLAVSAVATITYTTYHGSSGSPVKLSSAIKSLRYSFLPLASTALASLIIQFTISLAFVLFLGLIILVAENLGFEIDYKSSGFIGFCIILSIILLVVLFSLQVNWALGCVIAVVELKWGFEPLWRSAYLVKGMRSVTTSLLLLPGASFLMLIGGYSVWANAIGLDRWRNWIFISQTVECTGAVAVYMIGYVVVNAVVFVYCKSLHGESSVTEEFAGQYVSLPLDDEKLLHIVQV